MTARNKGRLSALGCAAALGMCASVVRPNVETGMMDEWSYVWSAQVLEHTGRLVYNGWATAMIGWQIAWGALCFKLFGDSFFVARLSMLVIAMAMVYLVQRCMVRMGVGVWNATVATLAIVCTPVMLPLSLSFMTDISGMFVIVVCLYACLRAVDAETERAQMAWLCFAALGNAVGGSARQIAWLGVLVMVPSTLWLLRYRRRVRNAGVVSWVVGVGIVFWTMHWFARQPYSVEERLHRTSLRPPMLLTLPGNLLRPALETVLFLLPVSLMFLPSLWRSVRRARAALAVCAGLGLLAYTAEALHFAGRGLLAPFLMLHGNYVSTFGLWISWPEHCHYPVVLHTPVRIVLTVATVLSVVAIAFTVVDARAGRSEQLASAAAMPWRTVGWLLVPFTLAYAVLLLPRGIAGETLDRYLLPLIPVLLVLLLRLYQQCMRRSLPWLAVVLVLATGVYSVAATHDLFANYRGSLAAIDEMRAAGVPRRAIDGGWEYDGWTQLQLGGYMHQQGARMPNGGVLTYGQPKNVCPIQYQLLEPDVDSQYSLSFEPNVCEGRAQFAPVTIHRWLAPHSLTVYVVRNPLSATPSTAVKGGPEDLTCEWGCSAGMGKSLR